MKIHASGRELHHLIETLQARGVQWQVEGQDLRLQAPKGSLTPQLRQALKVQKEALIAQYRPRSVTPARPIQSRLWFLQRLEPQSARYHESSLLRLSGDLPDPRQVEWAFQTLQNRHSALRSRFFMQAGQVLKDFTRPLEQGLELRQISLVDGELATRNRAVRSEIRRPFELEQGNLFRVSWLSTPGRPHEAYLLCVFHHLIADAWSAQVLLRECLALIRGESLEPLPAFEAENIISEADGYAPTPPDHTTSQDTARGLLDALPSRLASLSLPRREGCWHPGQPVPDEGASCSLELPPQWNQELKRACRAQGVTAFCFFLSAWSLFLARYWRLPETILATPLTERQNTAAAAQVDCLINTLLLPLSAQAEWPRVLHNTQAQLHQAMSQGFDFQRALDQLNPPRELPFFPQLAVVMQPGLQPIPDLPGLRIEAQSVPWQAAKFELLLTWFESENRLELSWPLAWYVPREMQTLLRHFIDFWQRCLDAASTPAVLRPESRQKLLRRWAPRQTVQEEPAQASLEAAQRPAHQDPERPEVQALHQLVERLAQAHPERIALRWRGQSLSYRGLNALANRWAWVLKEHYQLAPGCAVGLQLPVGPELIAALLTILKIGGVYVPFEKETPENRRNQALRDAEAHWLISDTKESGFPELCVIPLSSLQARSAEREAELGTERIEANLNLAISSQHRAYVIYTSGSTGQPNGVPIRHGNVLRLLAAVAAEASDSSPPDREGVWLLFHSIAFDYSVWEIWGAFYAGARLVLLERADCRMAERVWDCILDEGVTELSQTPSSFRALSQAWFQRSPQPLPLKRIILSGEKLETRWLRNWWEHYGDAVECVNAYGITETTVFVTWHRLQAEDISTDSSPIGRPLRDLGVVLLDSDREPVPEGLPGEICVWGAGLSQGYLQRPELNAERFIAHEISPHLYCSGDLAVFRGGQLQYLRRRDRQVQLRGYRIECDEVARALEQLPDIEQAAVGLLKGAADHPELGAVIRVRGAAEMTTALQPVSTRQFQVWRQALRERLPEPMLPTRFWSCTQFPLTANGKIDRQRLLVQMQNQMQAALQAARKETEHLPGASAQQLEDRLAAVISAVLGRREISRTESFFDLGAHSLLLVEAQEAVQTEFAAELEHPLELTLLFQYPNVRQLAQALPLKGAASVIKASQPLEQKSEQKTERASQAANPIQAAEAGQTRDADAIAVIGMGLRLPGADSPEALWDLLRHGRSAVRRWSETELRAAGESPERLRDPQYVPVSAWCADPYLFDAGYFGVSELEARWLDPQQRLMLTLAHETLEQAGYGDFSRAQAVGVFASAGLSRYLLEVILPYVQAQPAQSAGADIPLNPMQILVANDKDYLATRVAYKLNLTGPALAVQTACSSSLLAVHLACQSLRNGECEMALAGGVTLDTRPRGYLYQPGGIYAQDGVCRPFDAAATGIVGGSGGAWALLKPLRAARRDGDQIYAVVEASAVNNDGASRVGYLAPGFEGQKEVIRQALEQAGVALSEIGYVEAHGTGTRVGDPIEVQALTQAWRAYARARGDNWAALQQGSALGSLKSNLGHLDAAAGIASFLKMALMLHHAQWLPSLNVRELNPALKLEQSPFFVAQTETLRQSGRPVRYGALSSLGVGGTNVHMICRALEETSEPDLEPDASVSDSWHILPLSAPSGQGLNTLKQHWLELLRTGASAHFKAELAAPTALRDLAWTLQQGRQAHAERTALLVQRNQGSAAPAVRFLEATQAVQAQSSPELIFLCPGLGSQNPGALAELSSQSPILRAALEQCCAIIAEQEGQAEAERLRAALLAPRPPQDWAAAPLLMQSAIFIEGWCLAQLWDAWGLQPAAFVGHSFGEILAACLGGMLELSDALAFVRARGRLFAQLPAAAVLALAWDASTESAFVGDHASHNCEGREALQVLLKDWPSLEWASQNSSTRFTLSGPPQEIQSFQAHLSASPWRGRLLPVSHPVHHSELKNIEAELNALAQSLPWTKPRRPVWSCLLQTWHTQTPTADYWGAQAREPLDFTRALHSLKQRAQASDHAVTLLELATRPQLLGLLPEFALSALRAPREALQQGAFVALLAQVAQAWSRGHAVRWRAFTPAGRRLSLPLTPLQPRHYSLQDSLQHGRQQRLPALKRQPQAQWLQVPSWLRLAPLRIARHKESGVVALSEIHLAPGEQAATLRQQLQSDASSLVTERLVVYFAEVEAYTEALELLESFRQLCLELKALGWVGQLLAVSPVVSPILGRENCRPFMALLRVALQTVSQEQWGWRSCFLETEASPSELSVVLPCFFQCFEEAKAADSHRTSQDLTDRFVHRAWLHGQAWAPSWQRSPATPENEGFSGLRPSGVYVITGAQGGIAQSLIQQLREHYAARLVLLSRRAPDKSSPDADTLALQVDVGEAFALGQALQQAVEHFGRIDGVFHTAVASSEVEFSALTPQQARAALAAKVQGCLNLQSTLQEQRLHPDFVMLFGALASFLPAPRQAAYAGACALCDALAESFNGHNGVRWLSLSWGHWREAGLAQRLSSQFKGAQGLQWAYSQYLALGLSGPEGWECIEKALGQASAQLAVMPVALAELSQWQNQLVRAFSGQTEALPESVQETGRQEFQRPGHKSKRAPSEPLTSTVLREMWAQYLGQRPADSERFSDLGGDSLAALQLKAQIERHSHSEVPLALLLEDLPFAQFAERLFALEAEKTKTSQASPRISSEQDTAVKALLDARGPTQPDAELLVPLNRAALQNAGTAPLYFVHAISGTVFPFQDMAQHCTRPLLGLQSRGLSQGEAHRDIETMATAYCQAVEGHSSPPYLIGGWSFGALVAFAMARQWLQRGISVQELVLLDMRAPEPQGVQLDEGALRERFETDLAGLGLNRPAERDFCEQLRAIFEAHIQATQSFQASPLELPARLWVAEQGFGAESDDPALGWHTYLPRLNVQRIPGDHYSCLHPEQLRLWQHQLNALGNTKPPHAEG